MDLLTGVKILIESVKFIYSRESSHEMKSLSIIELANKIICAQYSRDNVIGMESLRDKLIDAMLEGTDPEEVMNIIRPKEGYVSSDKEI